jgi:hypothetical protein
MFGSTGKGWSEFSPATHFMKLIGFLLLLAGGGLVLSAVALLASSLPRTGFVLAGVGVEALGLVFVARAHLPEQGDRG